uniref:Uncharacterized protein n=1 Tax=Knipowitschia caucasica TaxID=637954 RepID=A0AAV2IVM8_KNICA
MGHTPLRLGVSCRGRAAGHWIRLQSHGNPIGPVLTPAITPLTPCWREVHDGEKGSGIVFQRRRGQTSHTGQREEHGMLTELA